MIKKILPIFAVLIPVCILSFIAAGILDMFLGIRYSPDASSYNDELFDSRSYTVTDTTKAYDFELDALDSISLKLAGVDAEVMASTDDKIHVKVHNTNTERDAAVVLNASNDTSTVEVHPTNISFSSVGSGLIGWLEDLFTGKPKCKVWIMVPQKVYQNLDVMQGSGVVDINTISANFNNFTVGSGSLTFTNSPLHKSTELNLNLGSGSVTFNNSITSEYNFDIGSGKFDIRGLTGTGNVTMGSGSGSFSYEDYYGLFLEKGSGTLELLLPPSTPLRIVPELGSGRIEVDLDGEKKIIKDNNEYNFGGESVRNFLRVENGSGNIYIKNHSGLESSDLPQNTDSSSTDSNSLDIENSSDPEIASTSNSDSTGTSPLNAA